jgi:hypothetical protein
LRIAYLSLVRKPVAIRNLIPQKRYRNYCQISDPNQSALQKSERNVCSIREADQVRSS